MGLPSRLEGLVAYDSDTDEQDSSCSETEKELEQESKGAHSAAVTDAKTESQSFHASTAEDGQATVKRPRFSLPSAEALLDADESSLEVLRQSAAKQPLLPKSLDWKQPDALGRVRRFAPEEGSYATTVLIPVHVPEAYVKTLQQLLLQLRSQVPGLHPIGFEAPISPTEQQRPSTGSATGPQSTSAAAPDTKEVLHVSLSRTLPLRFHLVSSLVQELQEKLKECQGFSLNVGGTECFLNDERTRSFVAVPMQREDEAGQRAFQQMCRMIRAVNTAFLMHGLEAYYKDPRPHVSVAWAAGDQEQALQQALQQLPPRLAAQLQLSLPVSRVVCRLGHREHVVWTSASS